MKTYKLKRRYFAHGVFAELYCGDELLCVTVERPWLNNEPGKSCVPEGEYTIVPHESPKFGTCYALEGETLGITRYGPSLRSHILIHKANAPSELQGCIAPGTRFGYVHGQWAVVESGKAFDMLMSHFGGESHALIIEKA